MANSNNSLLEKITSLTKRRGFIYPGSEIYGGLAGFYDWGPLGVRLKWEIQYSWWRHTVQLRDDMVGVSSAIIMNPKAWEASGHVGGFSDLLIECPKCHRRFRVEDLPLFSLEEIEKILEEEGTIGIPDVLKSQGEEFRRKWRRCECGGVIKESSRQFNLMFKTHVGSVENSSSLAYLRPETAGGIFVNFKNVVDTMRVRIPFGIAQIGKVFRNEINPKDFIFRTREFEQMEVEYFVKPGDDKKYFKEWVKRRLDWYKLIGLKNIKRREVSAEERAHYSKETVDIEYKFPFGWQEIEGIANRGDFDLKAHAKASHTDLSYFDEETKERYVPCVIEPSAGLERIAFAVLCEAYTEEKKRIVLKLHPRLSPYKVAVFPLLANKPKLVKLAREIYKDLKKEFVIAWDDRGNIGKRYYSQDEIGTPYCITVDFDSLEKKDVTVRDRDSMKQERIGISELKNYLGGKIL